MSATKSWTTQVVINDDRAQPARTVPGRVCALRKSAAAIKLAHRKVRQEAARRGKRTQADTLRFAEYVIVFTTFPAASFSAAEILEWYRIRWQVELVFKRFKSLAQLGHLPKYDDDSAKAWLYGKLLVALLVEKLIRHASANSPGDTSWRRQRPPSAWRDFRFVLGQVTRTIEPALPLARMVHQWHAISRALAEPPRRRLSQLSGYFDLAG